ncbi:hypothetical protein LINGRAHAP2_LOCUS16396 [Linum grandiflorum]
MLVQFGTLICIVLNGKYRKESIIVLHRSTSRRIDVSAVMTEHLIPYDKQHLREAIKGGQEIGMGGGGTVFSANIGKQGHTLSFDVRIANTYTPEFITIAFALAIYCIGDRNARSEPGEIIARLTAAINH